MPKPVEVAEFAPVNAFAVVVPKNVSVFELFTTYELEFRSGRVAPPESSASKKLEPGSTISSFRSPKLLNDANR